MERDIEFVSKFINENNVEQAAVWAFLKGNVIDFYYTFQALRFTALVVNHEYYHRNSTGIMTTDFVSLEGNKLGFICALPKNITDIKILSEEDAIIWLIKTGITRGNRVDANAKFNKYPVRRQGEKI